MGGVAKTMTNHQKLGPDPILAPGKASRKRLESDLVGESVSRAEKGVTGVIFFLPRLPFCPPKAGIGPARGPFWLQKGGQMEARRGKKHEKRALDFEAPFWSVSALLFVRFLEGKTFKSLVRVIKIMVFTSLKKAQKINPQKNTIQISINAQFGDSGAQMLPKVSQKGSKRGSKLS